MTRRTAVTPDTLTRPRRRNEAELLRNVTDAARKLGWDPIHHETYSVGSPPGYPDLTLVSIAQRRTIWIELKGDRGSVSDHQRHWLSSLVAAGYEAYLFTWADWDAGTVERVLWGGADR